MSNNLTDKQKEWLDHFFGEANGDARRATEMVYAPGTAPSVVVGALQEEISKRTRDLITASSAKAYFKMEKLLDDPTTLGAKEIIAAAKDLMDRGGLGKTDKVEIKAESPVFYLPAKKESEDI